MGGDTENALRELERMAALATRTADWLSPDQPLYKWVGFHKNNSKIAWKVYGDHIEVLMLGAPRGGVMKSQEHFSIRQHHNLKPIPGDAQKKVTHFLELVPHLDYESALENARQLVHDSQVSPYLFLEEVGPDQHTPQRVPTREFDLATRDGFLKATTRDFTVSWGMSPHDRRYFATSGKDLRIALQWVADNQKRVPQLRGADIITELRGIGFKGDYTGGN